MTEGHWQDGEGVRAREALREATDALIAEIAEPAGHWVGQLSASAPATAAAVTALAAMSHEAHASLIAGGLCWLSENQNEDGGWGDTPASKSSLAATALGWAAFSVGGGETRFPESVARAKAWLGGDGAGPLTERIAARYGKDGIFSVPILMMLALCGRIDWREVPALPFERAAIPHGFGGGWRRPMVSQAWPALIAIGQIIHFNHPPRNPFTRLLRALTTKKTLRVLEKMQPANGGFLEATPLTSFVTMSLAGMGLPEHPVAQKGAAFLVASVRPDGSWPIETNLATRTSTLAVKALSYQPGVLSPERRLALREWLLRQQWTREQPETQAAPGGWSWTDLPGGVPDADDTSGALIALLRLGAVDKRVEAAGTAGVRWLLGLQNRDGGIPIFCRGRGDRPGEGSSPDLTAHALRAWNAWRTILPASQRPPVEHGMARALEFLKKAQRADGAWIPLGFANEHAPGEENPLYGTAQVVTALREVAEAGRTECVALAKRGVEWIVGGQNEDGGWGGVKGAPSTVEETALAVEALGGTAQVAACERGVTWLVERVESGQWREAAPIGFYFAKLWYAERLYPMIWTVGALGRATRA